jgi:hypothetical protein
VSENTVKWANGIIRQYGPQIARLLGLPLAQVSVVMDEMDHPAETRDDGQTIALDPGWFSEHPHDVGAILHEMTHAFIARSPGDVKPDDVQQERLSDLARTLYAGDPNMNYPGWQPQPETVQLVQQYRKDPTLIQKMAQGMAGLEPGENVPVGYATLMADYGGSQGDTTAGESNLDTSRGSMHPGHRELPGSQTGQTSTGQSTDRYLYAWDNKTSRYYKWYGPNDARNELAGTPDMISPDGAKTFMTWEQFQQYFPAPSAGDMGGAEGDGYVGPPGEVNKHIQDLKKRAKLVGQGLGSQSYAPFGYLEPTRRQGEELYLQQASSLYFQMWGTPPPPQYLESKIKDGQNLYELFDAERAKPAFRHTKFYRDQYSGMAAQVASALGMRP